MNCFSIAKSGLTDSRKLRASLRAVEAEEDGVISGEEVVMRFEGFETVRMGDGTDAGDGGAGVLDGIIEVGEEQEGGGGGGVGEEEGVVEGSVGETVVAEGSGKRLGGAQVGE